MSGQLQLRGVEKKFSKQTSLRIRDVEFPAGSKTWISAPNGTGKTTLLKIAAGLMTPDRGTVLWNGRSEVPRQLIGLALGFEFLHPHLTVHGNLLFTARLFDRPAQEAEIQLHAWGLNEIAERDFGTLSQGQKARVALARVFLPQPKFLLLDEPAGFLDETGRSFLDAALSDYPHTVLITSPIPGRAPGYFDRELSL